MVLPDNGWFCLTRIVLPNIVTTRAKGCGRITFTNRLTPA